MHHLSAVIDHRDGGATEAMQVVAQEELALARRYLPVLDTVITLSPLLGLLGTETQGESSRTRARGSGFTPP